MAVHQVLMEIAGVRMDVPSAQPVVVLREVEGGRHLPIWIGTNEATSIVFAVQGIEPPRPLTHDLVLSVATAFGRTLTRVRIHTVEEGVFHAALEFSDGTVVDSRASDAIALAARTDCPILCTETVLDEAGLVMSGDGELREPSPRPGEQERQLPPETQVEQFRDFLDNVDPEDF